MMNLMMLITMMILQDCEPCCAPSSSVAGARAALRRWARPENATKFLRAHTENRISARVGVSHCASREELAREG